MAKPAKCRCGLDFGHSSRCLATTAIDYNPANLDSMPESDLYAMEHVYSVLKAYAHSKGEALFMRRHGHIRAALDAEAHCERIYQELPEWARW